MTRRVDVLVGHQQDDFVEVEVVDYDNRSCNYQVWRHEDGTTTVRIEVDKQALLFRRTDEAMKSILQGVVQRIDSLTPREEAPELRS